MGGLEVSAKQHQGEGEMIFLWGEIAAVIAEEARRRDPNYIPEPVAPPTWRSRLGDMVYLSVNSLVATLFVVTPVLLFLMILFILFPVEFVQVLRAWK